MKQTLRFGITLGLICAFSGLALAVVFNSTKERILAQSRLEETKAIKEILPEVGNFEAVEGNGQIMYYKILDRKGKFTAVVFKALAKGYSSDIEVLVGMYQDGKISAVKILSQNETPGLGTRIEEPNFLEQFTNKDALQLSGVQTIAGATISSKAVLEAVNKKAKEILNLIRENGR